VALAGSLSRRWALGSGAFLGWAILAKLLPIVALPFVVAYFAFPATPAPTPRRRSFGALAAGIALTVVPFALALPGFALPLSITSGTAQFGGLNVLAVYNPTVQSAVGSLARALPMAAATPVFWVEQALGVAAIFGPALAWIVRARRGARTPLAVEEIGVALLWAVVGGILLDASPQSENVIAPLALLLLAAPALGRWARVAYATLSGAALLLYWALLTPVAYFYPLWVLLGAGAVHRANQIVIAYTRTTGALSQGSLWGLAGVVGGLSLLTLWGLGARWAVRTARVRPGEPA
jgi:hypothetical protein